MDITTVHVP